MKFPNKSYLENLRKEYPIGTKIQLISMLPLNWKSPSEYIKAFLTTSEAF